MMMTENMFGNIFSAVTETNLFNKNAVNLNLETLNP